MTRGRHIWTIHPLLLAAYPSLFLLAVNFRTVREGEAILCLVVSVAFAAVVLGAFMVWLKALDRAAVLTTGFVAIVFGFVNAWRYLTGQVLPNLPWSVVVPSLAFLLYAWVFVRRQSDLRRISVFLTMAALILLAFPVTTLARVYLMRVGKAATMAPVPHDRLDLKTSGGRPNIYYLIFDRYGNRDTLSRVYGFDNRSFLDELRRRGFHVSDNSYANYHKTAHSLASSLNFDYLDAVARAYGRNESDHSPLFRRLLDHRVGGALKELGYRSIHLGSWWEPTRRNPYADAGVVFQVPMLLYSLFETSAAAPLGIDLGLLDLQREQWSFGHRQFATLRETASWNGPLFAFAHVLIPHDPYIFGARGEFVSRKVAASRTREENYVNQVKFVNQAILDTVDHLLRRSAQPPVIVIQADEGPWPARYEADPTAFDWRTASGDELREKIGILSAFYLPDSSSAPTAVAREVPAITPVNLFRVVFNRYFNAGLPLLEDRHFVASRLYNPYDLVEVTPAIRLTSSRDNPARR